MPLGNHAGFQLRLILAFLLQLGAGASPSAAAQPCSLPKIVAVQTRHAKPLQHAFLRAGEHVRVFLRPEKGWPPSQVSWFEARATAGDYDNVQHCQGRPQGGCHAPVASTWHEIQSLRGMTDFDVAHIAELSRPGSHRLLAVACLRPEASPEPPSPTLEAVARLPELVVRRDDSYVGLLTELVGAPFVLWPAELPGMGHQTDLRLGADCAALLIYGRRRLGEKIPYVAPAGLFRYADVIGEGLLMAPSGQQYSESAAPVQVGDILHFGFQTAVLSQDVPPRGRLTADDVIIHTFHGVAEEVPLGTVSYWRHPVDILRWRLRDTGHRDR